MSLIFDLKRKLHNMYWPNVGQSKRAAKEEFKDDYMFNKISKNGVKNAIFSSGTLKDYQKKITEFAKYCNAKGIKKEQDITLEHCLDYLDWCRSKGNSVNTISSKAAAIGKVLGINTQEFNLESKRHIKNMRGRTLNSYCIKNMSKELTSFLKVTGLRRKELEHLQHKQIILGSKLKERILKMEMEVPNKVKIKINSIENDKFYIDFYTNREYQKMTKGGRPRIVECLDSTPLKNIKNSNDLVFGKQDKYFNIHFFRRIYAQTLYKRVAKDKPLDYYSTHNKCKFNKQALKIVSANLGHNRICVVATNYLDQ
ncbi:site-specific integrase (plasmid) [Haloimpatiens sp. FM7315]|uniref:site-specific integrase n=1 Tax=Haloimpatiens sp. FM7315 TaxID=3298609 RepID=UPI00370BBF73